MKITTHFMGNFIISKIEGDTAETETNAIAFLVEPKQGASEARRRVFQATTEPIVCLMDDDCLPEPEWADAIRRGRRDRAARLRSVFASFDDEAPSAEGPTGEPPEGGRT